MNSKEKVRLAKLKEIRDIQGSQGNWNYDEYMHGLFNGLELAVAIIEDTDPEFKDAPEKFIYESTSKEVDKFVCSILKDSVPSSLVGDPDIEESGESV